MMQRADRRIRDHRAAAPVPHPALQLAAEQEKYADLIAAAAACRKRINRIKARLRKSPGRFATPPTPGVRRATRAVNAIAGQSPARGVGVK